jgi:hypothetical protein
LRTRNVDQPAGSATTGETLQFVSLFGYRTIEESLVELKRLLFDSLPALLFTALGFLVMGYHPGLEDDGVYLTAVKADLNPALYPHNSGFFRLQTQATLFDTWMAHFVRLTGMSVAWAELFWHLASLFFILWASNRIAKRIFAEKPAQWAAVAMVSAMLTLPVAGTALNIADQHLHPRNLATALILLAVSRILDGKRLHAVFLLLVAFLLHPIMAALGLSFCLFLGLAVSQPVPRRVRPRARVLVAAAPLGWMFEPANPAWKQALDTRGYYFLYQWQWYEWLGALAPLFLFWLLWRLARKHGETRLAQLAFAIFAYGTFHQLVAIAILTPQSLARLTPLQPMRYLQLIYVFLALIAGGLLGRFLLQAKVWRWAVYLLVINSSMFAVQSEFIDEGAHLELPWTETANPWLQAFNWVRANTPVDAYFALDPHYLAAPGEGYRSFRALAERSQLSDAVKDPAVATQVPSLAPEWQRQQLAQKGWPDFRLGDFERLKSTFGVNWVVVSRPSPGGLDCLWHNATLSVCRIP